jgi:hypothetical protein
MPGQTEIGNLEYALVVDEQVGRLHVSMENVTIVKVTEPLEEL